VCLHGAGFPVYFVFSYMVLSYDIYKNSFIEYIVLDQLLFTRIQQWPLKKKIHKQIAISPLIPELTSLFFFA